MRCGKSLIKTYLGNICLFFIVIIICSCQTQPEILFFAERYWWDILNSYHNFEKELNHVCGLNNYSLKIIIGEQYQNYFDILKNNINTNSDQIIIVGPMMTADVNKLAELYSDKIFIILGAADFHSYLPSNIINIVFEREQALTIAGKLTAAIINNEYEYKRDDIINKDVGIVISIYTEKGREDIEAFKRGYALKDTKEHLVIEEIGNTNDKAKAARIIDSMNNQGVKIFYLKAHSLNPYCIERIITLGSLFIIEDWQYFGEYRENLLFSIEENPSLALAKVFEYIRSSNPGSKLGSRIYVPAQVLWGKAQPILVEFEDVIEFHNFPVQAR